MITLKFGKVAERGRVNLPTIRYYDREKLLPELCRASECPILESIDSEEVLQ